MALQRIAFLKNFFARMPLDALKESSLADTWMNYPFRNGIWCSNEWWEKDENEHFI